MRYKFLALSLSGQPRIARMKAQSDNLTFLGNADNDDIARPFRSWSPNDYVHKLVCVSIFNGKYLRSGVAQKHGSRDHCEIYCTVPACCHARIRGFCRRQRGTTGRWSRRMEAGLTKLLPGSGGFIAAVAELESENSVQTRLHTRADSMPANAAVDRAIALSGAPWSPVTGNEQRPDGKQLRRTIIMAQLTRKTTERYQLTSSSA